MLIVCPACASAYEIPIDRMGANGRQVRCAACRETWVVTAEAVATAREADLAQAALAQADPSETDGAIEGRADGVLPALPPPAADGVIEQAAPYPGRAALPAPGRARPTRSGVGRRRASARPRPPVAMLAAGLAACLMLPLAWLGRATVVSAMPQTATLYASIGLPVNLRGIEIRDLAAFQVQAQGGKPGELVVEGDLVGVARTRTEVPDLAVEVRDARDQTLYRWTLAAPRPALEAGETARFRASLSAPPIAGRRVGLRFVAAGEAGAGRDAAH